MFSAAQPVFQSMTLIIILQLSLLLQHYANPYLPLRNGTDPLNKIEYFTLLAATVILTNGVLV